VDVERWTWAPSRPVRLIPCCFRFWPPEASRLGDNLATGVALLNLGASSTTANLTAFAASGALLAEAPIPQRSRSDRHPNSRSWIPAFRIGSGNPKPRHDAGHLAAELAGFFLVFDADFSRYADGVNATSQTGTDLMFLRHPSDPWIRWFMPCSIPGLIPPRSPLRTFRPRAHRSGVHKLDASSQGQWIFDFASAAASSGYVRVQSDRPVSGLQSSGIARSYRHWERSAPAPKHGSTFLTLPSTRIHHAYRHCQSHEFATSLLLTAYRDNASG